MSGQQSHKNGHALKRNMQSSLPTRTKSWTNYVGAVMKPCNFASAEPDPAPWLQIVEADTTFQSIDREIHNFMEYMKPTPEELAAREDLVRRFQLFIQSHFKNGMGVTPFGSYVTGLYLPSSDIDIVLTLPRIGPSAKVQLGAILAAVKASGFASKVDDVLKATVPLIRIKDEITSIDIDLTASDGHALRSTAAVQKWLREETELKRALIFVLKRFLATRRCGTTYTGGINSYLLVWLVVAWVSIEWPKVKAFAPIHPPPASSTAHQTGTDSTSTEALSETLGDLNIQNSSPKSNAHEGEAIFPAHLIPLYTHALLHFFKFYGRTFRYHQQAIEIEPRPHLKRKIVTHEQPYLLSICDPADPSIDMGSKSYGIKHVQATFVDAYARLQKATQLSAEERLAKFPDGVLHDLIYE
ncbi:hypothetical protein D9619_008493 [Psilocybe cf. subviscida]|uniref:polynucleotide adenylyltransferase n=1 Tax=Psilocybe cf. subviscida TaxID=2480587 RepID=A0A8H5BA64_9AGAR|nr:hypothetical protein D9619_008493 [Psilocybe cf. subviscida]